MAPGSRRESVRHGSCCTHVMQNAVQNSDELVDLAAADDVRRGDLDVIAAVAVVRAGAPWRISSPRSSAQATMRSVTFSSDGERAAGLAVGDELHAREQAEPADVADDPVRAIARRAARRGTYPARRIGRTGQAPASWSKTWTPMKQDNGRPL